MNDYKLMPEEATPEMLAAGEYALEAGCYVSGIYADMRAAAPDVQVDPVGYIRKSALELMKSAELGVRANIIKEPRYRDCVAIYTTPQTAEQQPDRDVRALAAALYQACGAYDMPTRVLDVLSAVANGLPFSHMIDGLLPCVPPSNQNVQGSDYEALQDELEDLRKDAERYRFLCNPSGAEETYLAHAVNTLNSWADKIEIDQAVDSAMRERYYDN